MSLWGDALDDAYDHCEGCQEQRLLNADNLCRDCAEADRQGLLWT